MRGSHVLSAALGLLLMPPLHAAGGTSRYQSNAIVAAAGTTVIAVRVPGASATNARVYIDGRLVAVARVTKLGHRPSNTFDVHLAAPPRAGAPVFVTGDALGGNGPHKAVADWLVVGIVQGKPSDYELLMKRIKALKQDQNLPKRTRERLQALCKNHGPRPPTGSLRIGKTRWDARLPDSILAVTTADCPPPARPIFDPSLIYPYKPGWGPFQLIAVNKDWRRILWQVWRMRGCLAEDVLIATLIHEQVHTEQRFNFPYTGTRREQGRAEAAVEIPAYCAQIEALCDYLQLPKYLGGGNPPPLNAEGQLLQRYKQAKQGQKTELQRR